MSVFGNVKTCILFPNEEDTCDILENQAGLATLISDDIFANSGFSIKESAEEVTV